MKESADRLALASQPAKEEAVGAVVTEATPVPPRETASCASLDITPAPLLIITWSAVPEASLLRAIAAAAAMLLLSRPVVLIRVATAVKLAFTSEDLIVVFAVKVFGIVNVAIVIMPG
jgi:hypothetical protein